MATLTAFEYNGGVYVDYTVNASARTINWNFYVRQYYADASNYQRWMNSTFWYYLEINGTRVVDAVDGSDYSGYETKDFLINNGTVNLGAGNAADIPIRIACGKTSGHAPTASNSTSVSVPASTYTITYKPGSGTGSSRNESKEYNKNYTIKGINSFSFSAPVGKEFDHWQGNNNHSYSGGDTYNVNANLTLTAQWKDSGPVVILDGNGRVFAHDQTLQIVAHAYPDDSGTKYGIRGTPLIENTDQLKSFKGYYTTPTFENAVKIYDLYQYNEEYLKNSDSSIQNYATVAVENTDFFGPATGTLSTTTWATENSGTVINPLPNIPSWKGGLTESLHLYALWAFRGTFFTTSFQFGDNSTVNITNRGNDNVSEWTDFIITPPANFEDYTPTGKRFVGWKCTNDNKMYQTGDTYYLGKFGETVFTFQAQYAQIETTVNLYANGGYFGNDTTDIGPKSATYTGGSYIYAYRGQPKHPKGWAFLGYFDNNGRKVYEPYDNAWYSTITPSAAKAVGDGLYFSSTSSIGTEEVLDEGNVKFYSDPPTTEDLTVYTWDYQGEEAEINLYAHWKSPSNIYIYNGDDLETAYVYINKAWPNSPQEEDWVQIDGANFF